MAQGRMLNRRIGLNKRVNDFSCDCSRLAFSWTIPHLDRDGRIIGDPAALKSLVFPRREDVSVTQFEAFIAEWADCGLVVWYEAEGDIWLEFPGFRDEQPHLRYDREPPSNIPSPDKGTKHYRSDAGVMPAPCRSDAGLIEGKVREGNVSKRTPQQVADLVGFFTESYQSQNKRFNLQTEISHIRHFADMAVGERDPPAWAKRFLETAVRLHKTHELFRDKPFLPRIHGGKLCDYILRAMGETQAEPEVMV